MKRFANLIKLSDNQLVALLIENDEAAVDYVFYHKFNDLLHYNAAKAVGNKKIEYADLIQELYLYLRRNDWEKLRKYDANYPFINWFSVVSYRFFKDFSYSMIDSADDIPISDMNDSSISMLGTSNLDMTIMDIKAAIAKLQPPRDKDVVEALILNEEEPAEVAARLNVTVDNLYNIKRRALAKLIQKHLQDYVIN